MADKDTYYNSPIVTREAVGAASAIQVPFDFLPCRVEVINVTEPSMTIWTRCHGQGGGTKIDDTGAGTVDLTGNIGGGNGVSVGPGGVTLGTSVQANADVLFVTAYRDK